MQVEGLEPLPESESCNLTAVLDAVLPIPNPEPWFVQIVPYDALNPVLKKIRAQNACLRHRFRVLVPEAFARVYTRRAAKTSAPGSAGAFVGYVRASESQSWTPWQADSAVKAEERLRRESSEGSAGGSAEGCRAVMPGFRSLG